MVRNEAKYEQAIQFRKRGFTLEEIAKICDISKSTASKWLKNKAFSELVTKTNQRRTRQENGKRLQLVSKARSTERKKRYKEAERSAETEYKHYKSNPLFIAGLMLYQSSGDVSNQHSIRFSSTNQALHKIFINFAREFLGMGTRDIRFQLVLHKAHKEETCMRSWHRVTGLPYSQFHKTQYLQSSTCNKPLHYGVGNTIIGNTVLKYKLNKWIELTLRDLKKA